MIQRANISLDEKTMARLKQLSEDTGCTMSGIIKYWTWESKLSSETDVENPFERLECGSQKFNEKRKDK